VGLADHKIKQWIKQQQKKIYNRPDFEIYTDENWVRTPGSAAWLSAGQRGVEIAKRQAMI